MATNTKPLALLQESDKKFSLKEYFSRVEDGSLAWLFLSNPPNLREVTMPLNACLFELAISYLIELGINPNRRIWFIIDELASLGRLNGFTTLMLESRKYGGCVIAATQSINQLFDHFGQYGGSSIFGQFATKFFFRTDEPPSTKIIADICGNLEYSHQQKNTSFGANEFRDGISYTEQQKNKRIITTESLASLNDHQCFVLLPEPKIRIAQITVPLVSNAKDLHQGFIQAEINNISDDNSSTEYNTQGINTDPISNNQNSGTKSQQIVLPVAEDQLEDKPWWQKTKAEYLRQNEQNLENTIEKKYEQLAEMTINKNTIIP